MEKKAFGEIREWKSKYRGKIIFVIDLYIQSYLKNISEIYNEL